jgi:hypothetical protein
MELSLICFNLVLDEAWKAVFARCCTVEWWQTSDLWFRDETTRAKEIGRETEPGDPTVGTRMKISLPRPKDFINFKHWLRRTVKGREMRERKEKEISAVARGKREKLWEKQRSAALEVIEAFARFSIAIRRKCIWNLNAICEFLHCWIPRRFEIRRKWKTMQTCRRWQLQ